MLARRLSLLVTLILIALSASALERASVKSASLALHVQPSASSPRTAQLAHGAVVRIDLKLNSPEGEWCLVRAEGKPATGYARCADLVRIRPAAAKTTPPPPPARSLSNEFCGNGEGDTWSQRYNWTPAQLESARALATMLGSCQRKAANYQQAFRKIGLSAQSFATLVQGWQAIETENHCNQLLVSFMDQLVQLATPEQRRLLDDDQRELRRMGKSPDLPLFCAY